MCNSTVCCEQGSEAEEATEEEGSDKVLINSPVMVKWLVFYCSKKFVATEIIKSLLELWLMVDDVFKVTRVAEEALVEVS